ncbi:MAG: hypothetical protein EPN75_13760 [Beijerinckiaceae bacterium]|nr:MAG: hypothetical protein EPN75_13760 [Beijerinckiaceae bacterium]
MRREIRSQAQLRDICLRTLKECDGFEQVDEILIQARDAHAGGANWSLVGFRPRVANTALRAARDTISELQQFYELDAKDAAAAETRSRRSL